MTAHELTPEERKKIVDEALIKMKIKRKNLSREELEKEIIDYLSKKQPCSLATCGNDCTPRVSVVDYVNEGLTIYILSEGGDKFKNLAENKKVAIGIGTGAKALKTRGVNIWGIAEVFTDDTPEFAHGIKVLKPVLDDMAEALGAPFTLPKGILRLIKVTPTKIVYHHTVKGVKHAVWEAKQ
jgi:uncharacterized pyridoxamine 5'-phosphate oxidase family protein